MLILRTKKSKRCLKDLIIYRFQSCVTFHTETSHLIYTENQMTGFYMKCNTGRNGLSSSVLHKIIKLLTFRKPIEYGSFFTTLVTNINRFLLAYFLHFLFPSCIKVRRWCHHIVIFTWRRFCIVWFCILNSKLGGKTFWGSRPIGKKNHFWVIFGITQPTITCLKLTIETEQR